MHSLGEMKEVIEGDKRTLTIVYPPRMSFRINRHLRVENYSSTTNLIQAYIAEYPQKIQA
jgi:hypothetical protein